MDPRHSEAFVLLKDGKHKEALPLLEAILKDDLADAAVLETLGDVREKLGDPHGALSAYAGAVVHLRARGELQRALGVIELMLVLEPTNAWVRAEAAATHAEGGDEAACWREIVEAASAYIDASEIERTLELCQRYEELIPQDLTSPLLIIEKLSRARQRKPAARLCASFGHALRKQKRIVPALELYARAVALDPACRDAHHARIGGLLALGQLDDAMSATQRALEADPRDVVSLTLLERICSANGDEKGAQDARKRFADLAAIREVPPTASGESVHEEIAEDVKVDTREDTASGEAEIEDVATDVRTDLDES